MPGGPVAERREASKTEATALKSSGQARGVEDLSVFRVKKETKRGKEHEYLHAAWMVGGKTRNVYPGELQEDEPPRGAGESETNEGAGAGIEK